MIQQRLTVEQLCRKLKPIFGKRIDDIYLKYAMAESNDEREEIGHILNALYHKNLGELLDNKVLLEPPKEELVGGKYPLGKVSYAEKKLFDFSLREQDWPRHVCISGMSGSGKTTLAINLVNNFIQQDKPFLIFDWKKSFRPLLAASSEIMCFTVGSNAVSNLFKMNINQPPKGIDPKEWINVLCDLLIESFSASFGVHKVLLETLDDAFKQWGVYEGSKNYPTWENIKWYLEEKINKSGGREAGWLESALRIASVLTFGSFGEVCNSKESTLNVEELLNKKVILELNSLGNIEKKFFCEFVLTYIYKLKKAGQNKSTGKFEHAIIVDEAHNIFLKKPTNFSNESVTDMIYREMREYGVSLICLDQHISKLSDTVKGNSACHIAFQQQLTQDIYDISGLMQLTDQRQFFSMLPVGSAIVKLSERHNSPFLIEVPQSELRDVVISDKDVESRTKAMMAGIELESGKDSEFYDDLVVKADPEIKVHYDRVDVKKVIDVVDVKHPRVYTDSQHENLSRGPEKSSEKIFTKGIETPEPVKEDVSTHGCTPKHFSGKMFTESIEITEKPFVYTVSDKVEVSPQIDALNSTQNVLYEFVQKKLAEGFELIEIEKMLEMNRGKGNYGLADVWGVINYALEKKLNEGNLRNVVPAEKQNIYNSNNFDSGNWQEKFLSFLRENHDQDYGTVEIYKKLGLSSRKGNKIKSELMEKNLIAVEEVRNDKGWKKIIRLTAPIQTH